MPIAYSVDNNGVFTASRIGVCKPTPDVVWIDAVCPGDNELEQLDDL